MENSTEYPELSRHIWPPADTVGVRSRLPLGNFGWLFRTLPPWEPNTGVDAISCLEELANSTFDNQERFPREHTDLGAGFTYLGAFITHDVSFNPSSLSQRETDPNGLYNFRTPALDLDSVYGRGTLDQPYLYEESNRAKLRLRIGETPDEQYLPRLGSTAVIADPRNDENIILSQLHSAFIRFHNEVVELLDNLPDEYGFKALGSIQRFNHARRIVCWHYQWLVIHDYLERILDPHVLARLKGVLESFRATRDPGLEFYRPTTAPYIPFEFSAAAFRFGHSMIRPSYRLNAGLASDFRRRLPETNGALPPFSPPSLLKSSANQSSGPILDLRGRRELPTGWEINWREFFDLGISYPYQRAMRIDTRFSSRLQDLPAGFVNTGNNTGKAVDPMVSAALHSRMPFIDLKRGYLTKLPSGETLARAMGIPKIYSKEQLDTGKMQARETPLFYYILKESELQFDGLRLGRLGSEIVGEVLLGLILHDDNSFAAVDPLWQPCLGETAGSFGIRDLLQFRAWRFIRNQPTNLPRVQ